MRKILLSSAAALFLSVAPASAQVVCCAPPPPVGGGASASASGASGGQFLAYGVLATATWFAVLNPKKGSDSILANTIHKQWWCSRKDWRERCRDFVALTRAEQNALRKRDGVPIDAS